MPQLLDLTAQFIDDYSRLQQERDRLQIALDDCTSSSGCEQVRQELAQVRQQLEEAERQLAATKLELESADRRIVERQAAVDMAQHQLQAKNEALKFEREQHAATKREVVRLQTQVNDLTARLARSTSAQPPLPRPPAAMENRPPRGAATAESPSPELGELNERIRSLEADNQELHEEVKLWKRKLHGCEMKLLEQRRK